MIEHLLGKTVLLHTIGEPFVQPKEVMVLFDDIRSSAIMVVLNGGKTIDGGQIERRLIIPYFNIRSIEVKEVRK